MKEEDLLIPIDHSQIPNIKNIDPYFLDLPFDPRTMNIQFRISGVQLELSIILD